MMIKLSIILPAYNNIDYLKIAIDSVLKQNFKYWELIISDDASSDGSIKYLKKINHKKIRVFFQKKNLGIYGNLTFLHKKTKSPIIKILCGDDKLAKNSLKNIYEFMKKNDSCKLMSCGDNNYQNKYSDTFSKFKKIQQDTKDNFIRFSPISSMIALLAFGNLLGNLSRVTYRKVNDGINPVFNNKLTVAGDYYAWAKYAQTYGFYIIQKKFVYIRDHPMRAGLSIAKKNNSYPQLYKTYQFLIKNINKKNFSLIRKYSLINNYPQRITSYLKLIFSGKVKQANKCFKYLPFNIKAHECFLYSVIYKFRYNRLNKINDYYTKKILTLVKINL